MVWIVAIIIIFTVSLGWWVSLPIVLGVAQGLDSSITDERGKSISMGVQFVAYAWGPISIMFIVLWAVMSSQRRDIDSSIYR